LLLLEEPTVFSTGKTMTISKGPRLGDALPGRAGPAWADERLDPAKYREGYSLVDVNPPGPDSSFELTVTALLEAKGKRSLGLLEWSVAGLRAMGSRRSLNVDRESVSPFETAAYEEGEEGGENRIRWTGDDIFRRSSERGREEWGS
jgi:hypothetical protein